MSNLVTEQLKSWFIKSISSSQDDLTNAHKVLKSFEESPNFLICLFEVICSCTDNVSISLAASIYLKNYIRLHWPESPEIGGISSKDKAFIKLILPCLLLSFPISSSDNLHTTSDVLHILNLSKSNIDPAIITSQSSSFTFNSSSHLPSPVKKQLYECLTLIAETDFPIDWDYLLTVLARVLSLHSFSNEFSSSTGAADLKTIISQQGQTIQISSYLYENQLAALEIIHSTVKKYRYLMREDEILYQLKQLLTQLQQPLLLCCSQYFQYFKQLYSNTFVSENNTNSVPNNLLNIESDNIIQFKNITFIIQPILTSFKIFQSLNTVDLPEYFEDNMNQWFGMFFEILHWQPPLFTQNTLNDLDIYFKMQSQICDNMKLYSDKYQHEFSPFVLKSIKSVWELVRSLKSVDQTTNSNFSPNFSSFISSINISQAQIDIITSERLFISSSLNFLASTAATRWDQLQGIELNPFLDQQFLKLICTDLIIPNVYSRDYDFLLMEENPQDFLRKDLEGSDQNIRRAAALELVKSSARYNDEQITSILLSNITELSNQCTQATGAAEERLKESCTYLMIAVAVRSSNKLAGVTSINETVGIFAFFNSFLLNELNISDLSLRPICKSAALKFLTAFRNHFDPMVLETYFPIVVNHLMSPYPIVSSYAAYSIERLLTIKKGSKSPFNIQQIRPCLISALETLLDISTTNKGIPDNELISKCIMRIFSFLDIQGLEVSLQAINQIIELIKIKANKPINPLYNHYLFETIGIIVKITSSTHFQQIEGLLLPLIGTLISQELHDFSPYCLQLLGLLLDVTKTGSEIYEQVFKNILDPSFWKASTANVPGLVRLISSYFRKFNLFSGVIQSNIQTILERLQYCIYHHKLFSYAFELLNYIYRYLPFSIYSTYYKPLITLLLSRLNENSSNKYFAIDFVTSCCLFMWKEGSQPLISTFEQIQTGLTSNVVQHIFLKHGKAVDEVYKKKIILLGFSKLCVDNSISSNIILLNEILKVISHLVNNKNEISAIGRRGANNQENLVDTNNKMDDLFDHTMSDFDKEQFDLIYAKLGSAAVVSKDLVEEVTDVSKQVQSCLICVPAALERLKVEAEMKPLADLIGLQ